jgi:hypothetical protein
MMMDTWMTPSQGGETGPMPVTLPGRGGPAAPESVVAQPKIQPTVYRPSATTDHRHAA